jgi:hypothetical protein
MPARRWSDAQRSTALDVFAREGCAAASAATGVPEGTIRSWAKREGDRAGSQLDRRDAVEVMPRSAAPWRERRDPLVRDLGELVSETLSAVRDAVQAGRLRDARDGMVAAGIAIDKCELLSGFATSRSEAMSVSLDMGGIEIERRIVELEHELGYR